jgi:hypothetical protein
VSKEKLSGNFIVKVDLEKWLEKVKEMNDIFIN